MPNIYGFVGGDIVSGDNIHGHSRSEELSLLVDIGTNNEMVLGNKDFMLCCSAAAGPALEGAKIKWHESCSRSNRQRKNKCGSGIKITTINDMPPVGICGSGLVDAISELLKAGVITQSGRFADKEELEEHLSNRSSKGIRAKTFHSRRRRRGKRINNPEVGITQKDIREIQLAKEQ